MGAYTHTTRACMWTRTDTHSPHAPLMFQLPRLHTAVMPPVLPGSHSPLHVVPSGSGTLLQLASQGRVLGVLGATRGPQGGGASSGGEGRLHHVSGTCQPCQLRGGRVSTLHAQSHTTDKQHACMVHPAYEGQCIRRLVAATRPAYSASRCCQYCQ